MKIQFLDSIVVNWEIVSVFTKREIQVRYKGSKLGFAWALINPLMMLCVYTLIFSEVFQAKWGSTSNINPYEYGLNIFTGLIIFNVFAESIARAPTMLLNNQNYLKKIVFPIEVLGVAQVGSAVINSAICMILLVIGKLITSGQIQESMIILPLIMGPFVLICLGSVWTICAIGVLFRDISQLINAMISVLMFMSPIFYSKESLPDKIRWIADINPIAITIEATREVVNFGEIPRMGIICIWWIVGICTCELGFRCLKD